ncbi:MAG TPA: hypothetical protein VGZ02_01540 [Candidatus Baltobacteraceae bacterium]|nr:hypothetical protein [Candidatus Baltobacteraceae bacterium]
MNLPFPVILALAAALAAPTPSSAPKPSASASKPAPRASAPVSNASAPKPGAGFSFQDWHVQTNQLDTNWQTGVFNAPGHITLTRTGSDISADRANGNFKAHQATLTGHVVLHDTNGVLTNFAGEAGGSRSPATLTCDVLNIQGTTKQYVATGNVYFKQGGSEVHAGRAVMDGVTHEIHLYDNVQLTQ